MGLKPWKVIVSIYLYNGDETVCMKVYQLEFNTEHAARKAVEFVEKHNPHAACHIVKDE